MMSPLLVFMFGLTIFLAMSVLACIMLTRTSRAAGQRAVVLGLHRNPAAPTASQVISRVHQISAGVLWLRSRLGITNSAETNKQFVQAGLYNPGQRDLYIVIRVLLPVLTVGCGALMSSLQPGWIIALGGLSYLAPDIYLKRRIKLRRTKMRLGIPDAVDLLVICVDAGLGLDQAMLRVGKELESSHREIYNELLLLNREQRAGKPRLDAWRAMAERMELPEIDGFVNMLMQTERFGTPIARALSNYGDGIRQKRRQRAEELAAKTTVKIIFPLVLFIFPSLFIVLLGPAPSISRGVSHSGRYALGGLSHFAIA